MAYSVVLNIVITCAESPLLEHATRSTNQAVFGTVVEYQCNDGYHFHDNSTLFAIECTISAQWNDTVTIDCQRTFY